MRDPEKKMSRIRELETLRGFCGKVCEAVSNSQILDTYLYPSEQGAEAYAAPRNGPKLGETSSLL